MNGASKVSAFDRKQIELHEALLVAEDTELELAKRRAATREAAIRTSETYKAAMERHDAARSEHDAAMFRVAYLYDELQKVEGSRS